MLKNNKNSECKCWQKKWELGRGWYFAGHTGVNQLLRGSSDTHCCFCKQESGKLNHHLTSLASPGPSPYSVPFHHCCGFKLGRGEGLTLAGTLTTQLESFSVEGWHMV